MKTAYTPIACSLHDELQLRVMRGREVGVLWTDERGRKHERTGRLRDVFSRDGAEFLSFDDGLEVRLDRLVQVDGLAFSAGPGC